MKDEIKEILEVLRDSIDDTGTDKVNFINWVDKIEDCITNLQEKNIKKDNVINGIEAFIEYLDRETNVYLVNTAYTVILGKIKKLKIDNGLLQGSDKDES